jgi:pentatricopeptide repeat protein
VSVPWPNSFWNVSVAAPFSAQNIMFGRISSSINRNGASTAFTATLYRCYFIRLNKRPLYDRSLPCMYYFAAQNTTSTTAPFKLCRLYHMSTETQRSSFPSTLTSHGATDGYEDNNENDLISDVGPIATDRTGEIVRGTEALLKMDIGSFQYPSDFNRAQSLINILIHDVDSDSRCAQAVNACLYLLERTVREHSILLESQDNVLLDNQIPWFCNPFFFNGLIARWKEQAILKENIIPPRDLVQKLKAMSTFLPSLFRYDIATMNMIMQVIIGLEPPYKAPFVAGSLLDFIEAESSSRTVRDDFSMRPTNVTYSIILHAWSCSGLADAPEKMDKIMEIVHRNDCNDDTPIESVDLVAYKIWIRYWARFGNVGKVESIFAMVNRNERLQSKLDNVLISIVLSCYTKNGQINKAEDMFDRMISIGVPSMDVDPVEETKENVLRAIMLGANNLMNFYRRVIVTAIDHKRNADADTQMIVNRNIERAETVLEQIKSFRDMDAESVGKLFTAFVKSLLCISLIR